MDFLSMIREARFVDLKATSKEEALRELVEVLSHNPNVGNAEDFLKSIFEREKLISTGVGIGVALPHVKIPSVKDFVLAVGRSHRGLDFQSLDDKPVHLVAMIGASDKQSGEFLKVLARLVLQLKDKDFRREVMLAKSPEEVAKIFLSMAQKS